MQGIKLKLWRILVFSILGLGSLMLLWKVRAILTPFSLAFFLAYMFSPGVSFLVRHGLSRPLSIVLVYLLFTVGIGLLIVFGIPELYKELSKFANSLPRYATEVQQFLATIQQQYRKGGLPTGVVKAVDAYLLRGENWLGLKLQALIGGLISLVAALPLLLLSPILSIYLLADWEKIKLGLKNALPHSWRGAAIHVAQEANSVLRNFLRGHLTVATFVGVLSGLGFQLVGMEYAVLLGVVCGLLDLVPYFGPVIGAVPALALALLKSPGMALRVLIVVFVVQQVESNLIQPKIVGDSVGLHPLLVVFVLLAGADLFGFWGMLLAVPAAGILRVMLTYLYLRLV